MPHRHVATAALSRAIQVLQCQLSLGRVFGSRRMSSWIIGSPCSMGHFVVAMSLRCPRREYKYLASFTLFDMCVSVDGGCDGVLEVAAVRCRRSSHCRMEQNFHDLVMDSSAHRAWVRNAFWVVIAKPLQGQPHRLPIVSAMRKTVVLHRRRKERSITCAANGSLSCLCVLHTVFLRHAACAQRSSNSLASCQII